MNEEHLNEQLEKAEAQLAERRKELDERFEDKNANWKPAMTWLQVC